MSGPRDHETIYYRRSRFSTHLPVNRRYSPAHYWLLEESSGRWRVGFTRFATRMLGDIVEFNFGVAPGTTIALGEDIGSVEGLKAVTAIYSAGTGIFLGEGTALRQDVTLVETDPYGAGWLYSVQGDAAYNAVDVQGYVAILNATIDKMLAGRYDAPSPDAPDTSGSSRGELAHGDSEE